jgi:anti-sigma factor RsiW
MSCLKFVTDIALYAGGDLPAGRIGRIESHLAECPDCRALAEELRASRVLLGELRDEPLEDAMVAHVRQRVMAEVRAATRQPSRLYWKLALAATLALLAVLMRPRPHPAKKVLAHSVGAPRATAGSHAAQTVVPVARKSRHRYHRAPAAAQPGPPLLVQFVTHDPNIVIYWLVNPKTQGD